MAFQCKITAFVNSRPWYEDTKDQMIGAALASSLLHDIEARGTLLQSRIFFWFTAEKLTVLRNLSWKRFKSNVENYRLAHFPTIVERCQGWLWREFPLPFVVFRGDTDWESCLCYSQL